VAISPPIEIAEPVPRRKRGISLLAMTKGQDALARRNGYVIASPDLSGRGNLRFRPSSGYLQALILSFDI